MNASSSIERASAAQVAPILVSKSDYAAMRRRDPSAVSHWIKTRKLTSPALVGEGRLAKINVALADQQLAAVLDLGQQLSQPAPILGPVAAPAPALAAPPLVDPNNQRRIDAKAELQEIQTASARLKLEAESGNWVSRDAARRATGERLTEALNAFEGYIREQARTIADETKGDPRAIETRMLNDFRTWRSRMAATAREKVAPRREVAPLEEVEDDEEVE